VRINRILQPAGSAAMGGEVGQPCLSATWRRPGGTHVRGTLVTAQYVHGEM
jgi:hypothetical protein